MLYSTIMSRDIAYMPNTLQNCFMFSSFVKNILIESKQSNNGNGKDYSTASTANAMISKLQMVPLR